MDNKDRIRLAEAMGWTPLDLNLTGYWMPPGITFDTHIMHIERVHESDLPDPSTDANDDYAVLEWMRDQEPVQHTHDDVSYLVDPYFEQLEHAPTFEYEIGDYARAALKILEADK